MVMTVTLSVLITAAMLVLLYLLGVRVSVGIRDAEDEDEIDPGPLNDDALRRVLSSGHFRASKTLDRVQDAFDRLRRERDDAAQRVIVGMGRRDGR